MSNVRRRPSISSYFSFQRPHQRASSISSQHRPDLYEKPGRHSESTSGSSSSASRSGTSNSYFSLAVMSSRWTKFVTVVLFFCVALFFLAPGNNRETVSKYVADHRPHPNSKPGKSPAHSSLVQNNGQEALDITSGTKKCTKSSSSKKPLVQYALMVDAGSTGSRIHVYRFNNCGETPELEHEEFKMTQPGLSSFKEDAEGAAKSLDVLMDVAMENVPESLKSCSPVAVKATAGLRLLGEEKSQKILDAVRHRLETKYPFPVVAGDGVSIMDGKDEGVYAWITTNYLLGKIGSPEDTPTAAIFDLGGGSTQIVFQPTFPSPGGGMPAQLSSGDHKYELKFGGRDFTLYQHSHLGYGLMEARKSIHKTVAAAYKSLGGEDWASHAIVNPCIAPGMVREVEVELENTKYKLNMTGPSSSSPSSFSSGAATQCRRLAEAILKKEEKCELSPCSFNGIHQPSLERTFAKEDIYIFSYFFDRTRPLGMPDSFTIKEMKETTAKVCSGEAAGGWDIFKSIEGAIDELRGRPEHCLDLNFMVALLHTGYEMPIEREVKIAKKIKGNELGWCLGASLPLLDQGAGGWTCRIKEIS